ncbi:MAG: hypothetical protein H6711_09555 [Myxococcales bacterium]|nr:hypothetical protein [Myxococcales bacterium]
MSPLLCVVFAGACIFRNPLYGDGTESATDVAESTSGATDPSPNPGEGSSSSSTYGGDPTTGASTSSGPPSGASSGGDDASSTAITGETGSTGGSACAACDAEEAACDASLACQEVVAIAGACPEDSFFPCTSAGACEALSDDEAAEGLSLWSELLQCVAEECFGVDDPCAVEEAICDGTPACAALKDCIHQECACLEGNAALGCWSTCAQMNSAGADAWNAWIACQGGEP